MWNEQQNKILTITLQALRELNSIVQSEKRSADKVLQLKMTLMFFQEKLADENNFFFEQKIFTPVPSEESQVIEENVFYGFYFQSFLN